MKNEYEIRGDITVIFLARPDGNVYETTIDTCDLEKAKSFPYTWYPKYSPLTKSFYVLGSMYLGMKPGRKSIQKMTHLSRWVFEEEQADKVVDHINHDTLDNRRSCNLRWLTHAQNQANSNGLYKNNTSGHKGVVWYKQTKRWRVQVNFDGKTRNCGYFLDLQDAVDHSKKIYEGRMITHGY